MATVTHGISTASTSNATSYTSGSFTPAASDLLVAFVTASGTTASGTMTDSQLLGFTKITSALKNSGADTIYLFISNALAAASAMTVTFDCTGDAATGAIIQVARISQMTRTGSGAALQTAVQANQASGGTPAPAFAASAKTGNPTLGVVGNSTNPATMTTPTNWTEQNDTGFTTPATGAEYVSRDSGFTGTTITWGSTSGSAFGNIIVELDASKSQTLTASMSTFSGSMARQTLHFTGASMSTFSGLLDRASIFGRALTSGMSTFSGSLAEAATFGKALTSGVSTFSGTHIKQTGKVLTAGMSTFAGSQAKQISHILSASMSAFSALVNRTTQRGVDSSMSTFSGVLSGLLISGQASASKCGIVLKSLWNTFGLRFRWKVK